MKMISGEKVRFDQNVPEKNIVTLPNRNERFKLEWQQVQKTSPTLVSQPSDLGLNSSLKSF